MTTSQVPDPETPNEDSLSFRASKLSAQLKNLATKLEPFPTFLGRGWVRAVEVRPNDKALQGQRGCVVVCPDGKLYELVLRLLPGPELVSDPDPTEELVPLDFSDREFLEWAQVAIETLGNLITTS